MDQASDELLRALRSDCAQDLSELVQARRSQDFEALRAIVTSDVAVEPGLRRKAIYALGQWGEPEVVPAIRDSLSDLDEQGRISAIDALGKLGTQEALAGILDHADDASPQVRKFVVRSLDKFAAPEARAKLREMAAADPAEFVRDLAARSS